VTKHCGPFNDIEEEAESNIDDCCRTHDIEYSDPSISTETADKNIQDCFKKAGGNKLLESAIGIKQLIDSKTGYYSDKLFRAMPPSKRPSGPGEKRHLSGRVQKD